MNNKEASINEVDELVNRAQLAINDWQCSGDGDYVHKAYANLQQAAIRLTLSRQAAKSKKSELQYSVIGDTLAADYENLDLYDTPEEALNEVKDFLKAGDIVTVLEMAESDWQPYIDTDRLLETFQDQAYDEGGEGSEPWNDFITSEAMTAAVDELDNALNTVLKRWLDKYQAEAGWYQETGKKCCYGFDGTDFIRL